MVGPVRRPLEVGDRTCKEDVYFASVRRGRPLPGSVGMRGRREKRRATLSSTLFTKNNRVLRAV